MVGFFPFWDLFVSGLCVSLDGLGSSCHINCVDHFYLLGEELSGAWTRRLFLLVDPDSPWWLLSEAHFLLSELLYDLMLRIS